MPTIELLQVGGQAAASDERHGHSAFRDGQLTGNIGAVVHDPLSATMSGQPRDDLGSKAPVDTVDSDGQGVALPGLMLLGANPDEILAKQEFSAGRLVATHERQLDLVALQLGEE
jgi:hypothetical protein